MQGNGVKWFFFFLIVIPNCAFFLHWLSEMRVEMLKMALAKGKRFFKLVSCGMVDPDAFSQRHMQYNDIEIEDYTSDNKRYQQAHSRTVATLKN
jgi:hypothetical protein